MSTRQIGIAWGSVAIAVSFAGGDCPAEQPNNGSLGAFLAEIAGTQQMLKLPVRVVDADGAPVANAKVTPWALRSSQGHGWWREDDRQAGVGPKQVVTDPDGNGSVLYPYYRNVQEQTRTISVSLEVDHSEFAFAGDLHIDVPLETIGPHVIKLSPGIPLDLRPTIDGQPVESDDLFAIWSDGRSWRPETGPRKLAGGVLRIPAMPPGENSVLLVKLDGERATHFSRIIDVKLAPGEPQQLDVPLRPGARIKGVLSDNVPRPIRNGRIKAWTLQPADAHSDRVSWFTWVPVQADGTFAVDTWPADEPLQLIALCDGYIAASGPAPAAVKNPPDPASDPFSRPQMFEPDPDRPITLEMTPLVRCIATAIDEDGKPVAGLKVISWPNVGWWNHGSQIYCTPLVRGERFLKVRDYHSSVEYVFPVPFQGETDAEGKVTLELPAGTEELAVKSEVYELPAFLGRRDAKVRLIDGGTTEVVLRLQPRGTEKLGEWDKLAGVVFGCSTREGRRICALPGVQKQMEELTRRFREAENPRDPQFLSEVYEAVAEAFEGVGDRIEAAKWRRKAADEAAKAKAEPNSN